MTLPRTEMKRMDDTTQVMTCAQNDPNEILTDLIGPRFADYRRRFEAATRFETRPPYPLHVDFELNYGCNLRCPMCLFFIDESERPQEPRQRNLPSQVIRQLISQGVPQGLCSIGFSYYNEPLLRQDLPDLCKWSHDQGILDIHLVTNATLLDEHMSERLLDCGLTRIGFSLDAIRSETYAQTRVGADYAKVHANIHRFLDLKRARGLKLPLTRVSFCRTRLNYIEQDEFIAYWRDKVDYYVIQEFIAIHPTQRRLMVPGIQPAAAFRCPQSWQRLIIRADGTVLPCCASYGIELPMGAVYEASIESIWNSDQLLALSRLHQEGAYNANPVCRRCAANSTGG